MFVLEIALQIIRLCNKVPYKEESWVLYADSCRPVIPKLFFKALFLIVCAAPVE
jgi:2-C-methyl-D-erythritol 4-phosphate cytidylyltransferase